MKPVRFLLGLVLSGVFVVADLIECDNGDRYHGKVLSMDEKQVTLQNEVAGKLTIPRRRIVSISFREQGAAPAAPKAAAPALSQLSPGGIGSTAGDTNLVEKVRSEILGTASPEANQMFNEMVQGLSTGQLTIADLQGKAREALVELRKLQAELGDHETTDLLNTYGKILENFVRQSPTQQKTPPATPPAPNFKQGE